MSMPPVLLFMELLTLSIGDELAPRPHTVYEQGSGRVSVPERALAPGSLQVSAKPEKPFSDWNPRDNASSFQLLKKIAQVWQQKGVAHQYLVYGEQDLKAKPPFRWEIVPYQKSKGAFDRTWQQLQVLWHIVFGGAAPAKEPPFDYKTAFQAPLISSERGGAVGSDAFCKPEVIERQRVFEGKTVNILYNYAPIEELHFLFIPKAHKRNFNEISQEEYVETMALARRTITLLSRTRTLQTAYLYHKTGRDAGQTQDHWHMHLILTANKAQNWFGKWIVLKNMLLGSSPLNGEKLEKRVKQYRSEFKNLS